VAAAHSGWWHLDVVAVGVEHEGAVVGGVVFRAQAGRAVGARAGIERGLVERPYGRPVRRRQGDVRAGGRRLARADPEVRLAADPEPAYGAAFLTSMTSS